MTDIANTPRCSQSTNLNTGKADCYFEMKKPVMIIAAPMSHRITAANRADLATFKSFLQDEALAGNIFPFRDMILSSDNSEDMTVATDAYGSKRVVKDGDYDWLFETPRGGNCFNAIMRSFNQSNMGVYIIDSDMTFVGTFVTPNGDARPITTSFIYSPKFKIANGTDPSKFYMRVSLPRPEEINDAGKLFFVAGADENDNAIDYPTEIVGNFDVELYIIANANDAVTVGARLACGKTNLYDTYADAMAKAGVFAVTKSGSPVTVTGVTKDATNKGWILAHATAGECVITSTGAVAWAALSPPVGGNGESGYVCNSVTETLQHTT